MEFRPCIDIHNGAVKQIVGSSLQDQGDLASENFVATKGADYYASLYKEHGLKGGHIILLNPSTSPYYEATKAQAIAALKAFPGGMQIGGGITADNAKEYLNAGASHVIVTSYVFQDGMVQWERLEKLVNQVGKEHLVLDLSCRRKPDGKYYIVTDRWQKFTEVEVTLDTLSQFSQYCDEYLIHAVDVEGKQSGIDTDLLKILSGFETCPITYAGGVHEYSDLDKLYQEGKGNVHVTIGSALDLFGGKLAFADVVDYINRL